MANAIRCGQPDLGRRARCTARGQQHVKRTVNQGGRSHSLTPEAASTLGRPRPPAHWNALEAARDLERPMSLALLDAGDRVHVHVQGHSRSAL